MSNQTNSAQEQPTGALMFNSSLPSVINKIVLDSGATHHIINSSVMMFNLTPCNIKIGTVNFKQLLKAEGIGSAKLINQFGQVVVLNNVLLVPKMNCCLLSLPRLMTDSCTIKREGNFGLRTMVDNNFALTGSLKNNLFELDRLFKQQDVTNFKEDTRNALKQETDIIE
ncbi:hypothetical protein BY996DRAFT_6491730 [Phakopsora pachyrhizi]|nr:hypothetical protein BY996DRAFT_6491730 [Phakopsora pachyrhizi]